MRLKGYLLMGSVAFYYSGANSHLPQINSYNTDISKVCGGVGGLEGVLSVFRHSLFD
jgi:hypothetical protein